MDFISFYKKHIGDLEKDGDQYRGTCPFHVESGETRKKEFIVNPDNGLWNCFVCRKGGNTFTFCRKTGVSREDAPDYDPEYEIDGYTAGALRMTPKRSQGKGRKSRREGPRQARPRSPYNPSGVAWARELRRTLWICQGEADTKTLLEAGEQAIGIPSARDDRVLDGISLDGIQELIIVCEHSEEGERAARRISERWPSSSVVAWPKSLRRPFTVFDLKGEDPVGFVETLRQWARTPDPFESMTGQLREKLARDMSRQYGGLLGYELNRFRMFARNIDGLQPGLYLIGGETDTGKTALLCNLTLDLLETNEDLAVVFFSLGEKKEAILNRLLSIDTGIPLNRVQRRQKSAALERMLSSGHAYLMGLAREGRLFIRDGTEIKDLPALDVEIRRRNGRNLFVVIDGIYRLDTGHHMEDQRAANAERAEQLRNLTIRYQIPLICTGELRRSKESKMENRPPGLEDFIEDGQFAHNANLALLMYPEQWEDYDKEEHPIVRMKYAKNKLSRYRGVQRLRFMRSTGRLVEDPSVRA
jgi:hypothetical protein